MVELEERGGTSRESLDHLGQAINDALASGLTERELLDMVTTFAAQQAAEQPEPTGLLSDLNDEETIYTETEVPEGLIDLPAAAQKYNCPINTLQTWVKKGRLKTHGRRKAPARGGGYLLLVETEVLDRVKAPINKGGRPRKTPAPP